MKRFACWQLDCVGGWERVLATGDACWSLWWHGGGAGGWHGGGAGGPGAGPGAALVGPEGERDDRVEVAPVSSDVKKRAVVGRVGE